jgi:hypothetical protein
MRFIANRPTQVLVIASLGVCASAASASITVDGTVAAGEWSGAAVIATTINGGLNGSMRVASTGAGLFILGESTDDDAGTGTALDVFDVNFGLVGNAAAWRYRLQAKTGPTAPGYDAIAGATGWSGRLESGDDAFVSDPVYGVPGGAYSSTAIPATVLWSVGLGDSTGTARRVHEIFIPWNVILDGQNGWNAGADSLTFAFAGFLMQDDWPNGSVLTDPTKHAAWNNLSWGDQGDYAHVTLSIPAPGALALAGMGGLFAARRRR